MPDSLEAALTFSLVIVPGYQLVRGYSVARGADAPAQDLYVLAQAVVASLVWLAATWVLVEDLLEWIDKDTVSDNLTGLYATAPLIVGVPYAVGRVGGLLAGAALREQNPFTRWVARLLRLIGLEGTHTTWDLAWSPLLEAGGGIVTINLDDGREISGQFGALSFVATTPAEPAVYLERAYELREDGSVLIYEGGAQIEGSRIVALKFNQIG